MESTPQVPPAMVADDAEGVQRSEKLKNKKIKK
jgi:hypothetical protein